MNGFRFDFIYRNFDSHIYNTIATNGTTAWYITSIAKAGAHEDGIPFKWQHWQCLYMYVYIVCTGTNDYSKSYFMSNCSFTHLKCTIHTCTWNKWASTSCRICKNQAALLNMPKTLPKEPCILKRNKLIWVVVIETGWEGWENERPFTILNEASGGYFFIKKR